MKLLSDWDKWKASLWAWKLPEAPFISFRKEATILFLYWDKCMAAGTSAGAGDRVGVLRERAGPGECRPPVAHLISVFSHDAHLPSLLPPLGRGLS